MSKKLEESLNLRSMEDINDLEKVSDELNEIDTDLIQDVPADKDMDEHVLEMNEIYDAALKAHKEIIDLGYSVDTKYAGNILSTSAKFLEIAISASTSKIDKKLRKVKLDNDASSKVIKKDTSTVDGQEIVEETNQQGELLSRNDVLKKLEGILKNQNTRKKK